jgi:hypothetical protein
MINGKTFTAQYDMREDRIKLILNYADPAERIDFMITRAMFLKLVPAFEQLLPTGAKPLYPPKGDDMPQQSGITPTDKSTMHLTRKEQTILLEKVDFKIDHKKERMTMYFYGELPDTPEAQTTIAVENLEMIAGVILGAIPFTEWGIAPNILEC